MNHSRNLKIPIIFACIIFFNILTLFYFVQKLAYKQKTINNSKINIEKSIESITTYSFDDPTIAYILLEKLLQYEQLSPNIENMISNQQSGIIMDNLYCKKVLFEFIHTAEWYFQEKNIVTDYKPNELLRKIVIPSIGNDIKLKMSHLSQKRVGFLLPTEANMLFMHDVLHNNYYLGKHYGCINQLHNHIYDNTIFDNKSLTAQAYINYIKKFEDKPQCKLQFMPDSYLLENKQQCLNFFKFIESNDYKEEKNKRGIIFFLKVSEGLNKGLTVFNEELEHKIKDLYENGLQCGDINNNTQMQRHIPNLLMINQYNVDFRVFMLIASTNPLIAYYHDGFLKLSNKKSEQNFTYKNSHTSKAFLTNEVFKNESEDDVEEVNANEFQIWTFDDLQNYLLANGYINDANWIQNSLSKQLKEIMIHSLRMSQHTFEKKSQLFELLGCNFVLDNNLKAWLIEINTNPVLHVSSSTGQKFLVKMLEEMFDLMYAYLRSRMKRVIQFINKISEEIPPELKSINFEIPAEEYSSIKASFDMLNINYLEDDLIPSNYHNSKFQKIIDEDFDGVSRYSKILSEECL